jgi:hypothetical protein
MPARCSAALRGGQLSKRGNMNPVIVLQFVNLFFAGILAGMEIAIHYGFHTPTQFLSDQSQIQLRQALVLRLRVLVPAFFVPASVSGVAVAVLDVDAPGFWFRCAGIFAVLVWIVIRVIGTVPINPHLGGWRATEELESASRPRGALPCSGCLGGGGVRVLLDDVGTQTRGALSFGRRRNFLMRP